ncbi:NAD-dependent epimerase/dehydratase family protein [Flavobacterium sp.]|uniref:NAD-dependent epimerase/dehydratase family protein n=1 Tax=Flavobacterium sp. TaxID=239 RepID=UPI00286E5895|nr:NAD-dependent epimerase/dehydratase family protein [Flavobacterium sp.]
MKIAITGATGFIGKLLIEKHIDLGDEVHVLTRKKLNHDNVKGLHFHIGDLSDAKSLILLLKNADVLYHCAAEIKDESIMNLVNVEGTKNLIKAATGQVKHWVQLSSTGVYGPLYSGIISENQAYNPINEYEKTKLESDFLVLEATNNSVFTSTIVRPSNVFGFQMTNQSIFQLVKSIDKGFYFFVGFEKGASANYVPVENVIEALYLAATNPKAKNGIYIISSWCTIEEFIGNISKSLDKPFPKFRIPLGFAKCLARATFFIPKNPLTVSRINALSNRVIYETNKIETELDYKPVVSTAETIKDLVEFYKKSTINRL